MHIMHITPVTLNGSIVSLVPLERAHATSLAHVGLDPELWRLQPRAIASLADMGTYVDQALDDQSRGTALPFAIVSRATDAIIGSTRYMDVAPTHRRLEIGATWLAPSAQRTGANVEAKLLLLAHAFDTLGARKVVLKTETRNARSRAAILALGAVEEGMFRQHLIADDGRVRDMVYFGIVADEWPAVQARLRERLALRAIDG